MAKAHSYAITSKNNKSEDEAIDYLLKSNKHFKKPSKSERKEVMAAFGLGSDFSRAFDLILLTDEKDEVVLQTDRIQLIELKTTKKKLNNNPSGFFFGVTENEFKLARKMGDKYKFCFVSLHPESLSYKLLSLMELERLIKIKRVQYQINLK